MAAISIFLACNTTFLVSEQVSLYARLGYPWLVALGIAVLTEVAFVLLSGCASWAPGNFWRVVFLVGSGATGFVIVSLLNASVASRGMDLTNQSEVVQGIKKEILTQETLEKKALEVISGYNPSTHPTKINRLQTRLVTPGPFGHTHRLGELRAELRAASSSGVGTNDLTVLQWQRWAAMGWNVLLAGFLGFLLRRKTTKA